MWVIFYVKLKKYVRDVFPVFIDLTGPGNKSVNNRTTDLQIKLPLYKVILAPS